MSRNYGPFLPRGSDWISRVTVPDVYPRKDDPFRPAIVTAPGQPPPVPTQQSSSADLYAGITRPGGRPIVYQRAVNYSVPVSAQPVPLMDDRFECDTIIFDVYSSAANSVFYGFNSSVTVASGIEIRPGLPVTMGADNTREQWELQRALETMAALMAYDHGLPDLGPYRAARVVFNANDIWVVAAVPTALTVALFFVPEMQ